MRRKTLFWKIFLSFSSILILYTTFILTLYFPLIRGIYIEAISQELRKVGLILEDQLKGPLVSGKEVQSRVKEWGKKLHLRITVILPDGKVIADSEASPEKMENHSHRPEIRQAYRGRIGVRIRYSRTLKHPMLYVAIPIFKESRVIAVLRVSQFFYKIDAFLSDLRLKFIKIAGLSIALFLLISFFIYKRQTRSLKILKETAERIAKGELKARVFLKTGDELEELAKAINSIGENLQRLMERSRKELSQFKGIVSSISEPMVLIQRDGKIEMTNQSFSLFSEEENPEGKYYWEVIGCPYFLENIRELFNGMNKRITREIRCGGRDYLLRGTLIEETGEGLFVLQDVSKIKETERLKRDFIINASHELKTPLTSIKGYLETLEEEERLKNPEYLSIIKRNVERLIKITTDLLSLGKLESLGEIGSQRVNLKDLGERVVEIYRMPAQRKGLGIKVTAEDIEVTGDPFLLEQVLANLLDNAIKYTEEGKIEVRIFRKTRRAVIEVEDTGIGIEAHQIPRIFERFYVVHRARSREKEGTGLGLSIVKHIVLKHKGKIEVESSPGKGSLFRVILPMAESQ